MKFHIRIISVFCILNIFSNGFSFQRWQHVRPERRKWSASHRKWQFEIWTGQCSWRNVTYRVLAGPDSNLFSLAGIKKPHRDVTDSDVDDDVDVEADRRHIRAKHRRSAMVGSVSLAGDTALERTRRIWLLLLGQLGRNKLRNANQISAFPSFRYSVGWKKIWTGFLTTRVKWRFIESGICAQHSKRNWSSTV